jgi:hypothetical protein
MDIWTAPSDRDYAEAELPPERIERDPEYEAWLEEHGYLEPPSDADLELMRIEFESYRPAAVIPRVGVVDDDIAF